MAAPSSTKSARTQLAKPIITPAPKTSTLVTVDAAIGRRLSDLRNVAASLKILHQSPLETCRAIANVRVIDLKTRSFFAGLPEEEKHYWISSLYALLMPKGRRRKLAAYFTPPPPSGIRD